MQTPSPTSTPSATPVPAAGAATPAGASPAPGAAAGAPPPPGALPGPNGGAPEAPLAPDLPPEPKEDDTFSRRFAALTQRERAHQKEVQRHKADLVAATEYRSAKESGDPRRVLAALGYNVESFIDYVVKDGKLSPEQEIEKLKKRIEDQETQRRQEAEQGALKQQDAIFSQAKTDIKDAIDAEGSSGGERWELIRTYDQHEAVFSIIQNHWNEHEELLSYEDAADELEKTLEAHLKRAEKTKKFARSPEPMPVPAPAKTPEAPKPHSGARVSPTLTHSNEASVAAASTSSTYLSDEESKRRIARRLEESLARRT